jgi:hypothetical protein
MQQASDDSCPVAIGRLDLPKKWPTLSPSTTVKKTPPLHVITASMMRYDEQRLRA